jgi:formylglycine-generating enzyme required for sulfatase activity
MGTAKRESYRIQIIVVLIGVAGVLGAAVVSNWDKIFKEPVIPPPGLHVVGDTITNSIGMKLVYIPAGSFMMGGSDSAAQLAREYDRRIEERDIKDEFPQHQIRISEGF